MRSLGRIAIAAALFAAAAALRADVAQADDATLVLLVFPIALCATVFGLRGGVVAALIAVGVLLAWEPPLALASCSAGYVLLGGLLGLYVDRHGALEAELSRHYELSQDLFCTATFDGRFERLNPAWRATLGHSEAELCSRPFVDFVHPEDRDRTIRETAQLVEAGADTVSFRNRYRTAAGDYRWLEWHARSVVEEGRIYATARDITGQRKAEQALEDATEVLERAVRDRTDALQEARLEVLLRLASAAEYRDDDTHQHTERVGRTAALLARQLGLDEELVALIRYAAPLHDVGKLGIPDSILLKPGRLTRGEFDLMQEHVHIGCKILADGKFAVLRMAEQVALSHHERWDGSGYPYGLEGERIPLVGRIVAVADVFDALTHDRPYKTAWPLEDAVAEIGRLAGSHFAPTVVEAFAALDHESLLEGVQHYDIETADPPLSTPATSEEPAPLNLL